MEGTPCSPKAPAGDPSMRLAHLARQRRDCRQEQGGRASLPARAFGFRKIAIMFMLWPIGAAPIEMGNTSKSGSAMFSGTGESYPFARPHANRLPTASHGCPSHACQPAASSRAHTASRRCSAAAAGAWAAADWTIMSRRVGMGGGYSGVALILAKYLRMGWLGTWASSTLMTCWRRGAASSGRLSSKSSVARLNSTWAE